MGTSLHHFFLELPHVHNTYFLLSLFGALVSSLLILFVQQTSSSLASRICLSIGTFLLGIFNVYSFFLFIYRSIYSLGPKAFDEKEFTFPWRLVRLTDNLILTWLIYSIALLNFWVYDTSDDKTAFYTYSTSITNIWEAWGSLVSTTVGLWAGVGFGDTLSTHWASRLLTGIVTANGYLFNGLLIGLIVGLAIDYAREKRRKKSLPKLALAKHDSGDDEQDIEMRL